MYKSLLVAGACLVSPLLIAADAENGAELYHEVEVDATIQGEFRAGLNCESCHNPAIYTREDRRVTSWGKLESMVERCNTNLDVGWFPEDVTDVATYLNETYYKLDR